MTIYGFFAIYPPNPDKKHVFFFTWPVFVFITHFIWFTESSHNFCYLLLECFTNAHSTMCCAGTHIMI